MQRNKSELFEIEKIVGKKVERNAMYFLVKWKGYPNKENTWEPIENFMDFKFLLEKVDEFDHNTRRISDKHKKVVDYKANMSIEEESAEERTAEGLVRKFVRRPRRAKRFQKKGLRRPSKSERKSRAALDEEYKPHADPDAHAYPGLVLEGASMRKTPVRKLGRKSKAALVPKRFGRVQGRAPQVEVDDRTRRRQRRLVFKQASLGKAKRAEARGAPDEEEITIVRKTSRKWGFDPFIVQFEDRRK